MRAGFRAAMTLLLSLSLAACVNYTNLYRGIASFKAEDYRAAFIRLKPEALKGQPDAQYAIGYMYYYGQGVVEDRKKAWVWINRAARAGQPDAVQALAILTQPPAPPRKSRNFAAASRRLG
ncbi:Sel-1 protein [Legionella rubrilucens]|uniref:Sel-1 protein n=1 Tax=Legionella rubrilucens TaxID=458 RepID=A0A0W0XVZ8_9GAMM|nr:SEL1-like repeat protein [Legionella rubrilucens]KTD48920.1 Sel-1 protein [Legionella rubrilucens]